MILEAKRKKQFIPNKIPLKKKREDYLLRKERERRIENMSERGYGDGERDLMKTRI